jgi:putative SOS response-associated peptidase YedK
MEIGVKFMCGRFSLTADISVLQELFQFEWDAELMPRYNIAPSQTVLTVISNGEKRIGMGMKWGLVPYWAKDPKIGYKMINARAETVEEKASFKHPFKRRRCLILADGFYEWKKEDNRKQPYRIQLKGRKPFAFAGLWEIWNKGGEPLHSCTIITTTPNEKMKEIHDRMPVIVPEDALDIWLNPKMDDTTYLKTLLVPYPSNEMEVYPVSTLVNSPKNDVEDVLSPLNS